MELIGRRLQPISCQIYLGFAVCEGEVTHGMSQVEDSYPMPDLMVKLKLVA